MRDIEFLAYNKNRGMVQVKGLEFIRRVISTLADNGEYWIDSFNDMSLLQYTGRKDREGAKIYDGAIWFGRTFVGVNENEEHHYVVEWDEEKVGFQFRRRLGGGASHVPSLSHSEKGVVVGHTLTHPELIKSIDSEED